MRVFGVTVAVVLLLIGGVLWHATSGDRIVLRLLAHGSGPDPRQVTVSSHGGGKATSDDPEVVAYIGELLRDARKYKDDPIEGEGGISGSLGLRFSLGRRAEPRIVYDREADALMIVAGEGPDFIYAARLDEDAPDAVRKLFEQDGWVGRSETNPREE